MKQQSLAVAAEFDRFQRPTRRAEFLAHRDVDQTNRRWHSKLKVYPEVREQNRLKSKTRSRVEHIFGVMKPRFGFTKVRFRGLAKNLHRLEVTWALINLYTAGKRGKEVPQPICA